MVKEVQVSSGQCPSSAPSVSIIPSVKVIREWYTLVDWETIQKELIPYPMLLPPCKCTLPTLYPLQAPMIFMMMSWHSPTLLQYNVEFVTKPPHPFQASVDWSPLSALTLFKVYLRCKICTSPNMGRESIVLNIKFLKHLSNEPYEGCIFYKFYWC